MHIDVISDEGKIYQTNDKKCGCSRSFNHSKLYNCPIPCIHQIHLGIKLPVLEVFDFPEFVFEKHSSFNLEVVNEAIFSSPGRKPKRNCKGRIQYCIKTSQLKYFEETIDKIIEFSGLKDRNCILSLILKRYSDMNSDLSNLYKRNLIFLLYLKDSFDYEKNHVKTR